MQNRAAYKSRPVPTVPYCLPGKHCDRRWPTCSAKWMKDNVSTANSLVGWENTFYWKLDSLGQYGLFSASKSDTVESTSIPSFFLFPLHSPYKSTLNSGGIAFPEHHTNPQHLLSSLFHFRRHHLLPGLSVTSLAPKTVGFPDCSQIVPESFI